jgi:hypothetical protein
MLNFTIVGSNKGILIDSVGIFRSPPNVYKYILPNGTFVCHGLSLVFLIDTRREIQKKKPFISPLIRYAS